MQPDTSPGGGVTVANVAEFFRDLLRSVLAEHRVAVEEQPNITCQYVDSVPEGQRLKPLVGLFPEALQAASGAECTWHCNGWAISRYSWRDFLRAV
jgi:hypothetical protein